MYACARPPRSPASSRSRRGRCAPPARQVPSGGGRRPRPVRRSEFGAGGSSAREAPGRCSRPADGVFPAAERSPARHSDMRWLGRMWVPSAAFVGHRSGYGRGGRRPVPSSPFSSRSSWQGPRGGSRPYGCVVPLGARATRGAHRTLLCCCRLTRDSSNGAITFEKLIKRRTQPAACHPRRDPWQRVSSLGELALGEEPEVRRGHGGGWPPLPRGRLFQLSRRQHGNLGVGRLSPALPIWGCGVFGVPKLQAGPLGAGRGAQRQPRSCGTAPSPRAAAGAAPRGASVRLPAAVGGGRGSGTSQGRCGTHPTDNNRRRTATCSSGCASEWAALERGCEMRSRFPRGLVLCV